jgi:hypothetical protein
MRSTNISRRALPTRVGGGLGVAPAQAGARAPAHDDQLLLAGRARRLVQRRSPTSSRPKPITPPTSCCTTPRRRIWRTHRSQATVTWHHVRDREAERIVEFVRSAESTKAYSGPQPHRARRHRARAQARRYPLPRDRDRAPLREGFLLLCGSRQWIKP